MNRDRIKKIYEEINDDFVKRLEGLDSVDISIGIINKKYSFVIRGKTQRNKFISSNLVSISKKDLGNNIQLIFSLEDDTFLDLFIKLIEDIYITLMREPSDAVNKAYNRWLLWKELFSNVNRNILSEKEIQGLIGELHFLKKLIKTFKNESKAINSWGGSEYNKKDFEFDSRWCEVKASLNKNLIKISSIEQLMSKKDGYLVVIELEKSTKENCDAINLNKMVKSIMDDLVKPDIIDLFSKKVSKQGYIYNEAYDEYNYTFNECDYYLINNSFPKLTKDNIPLGIVSAKYELSKMSIETYKVLESEVLECGEQYC